MTGKGGARLDGAVLEEQAADFLLKARRKFKPQILERRFRSSGKFSRGEIDLVVEEIDPETASKELIFVEVRGRSPGAGVSALESITQAKRKKIEAAAEEYLARYKGSAEEIRFDVLAWDGEEWEHVPSAW